MLGSTRFIGPPAVRKLVEKGHEVAVFHRGKSNSPLPAEVLHIYGERDRLTEAVPEFRRFRPDVVRVIVIGVLRYSSEEQETGKHSESFFASASV